MPHLALPCAVRARFKLLAALGVLTFLSACAQHPQLTAEQEATDYRSHAHRAYHQPGPASDPWRPYVKEASERFDVPERWIREVMRQESGGKALAQSGPGAMGLMQVMPGTYDELRGRYPDLGLDAFDPHDNIVAGTAYIRELYDIYGSPGFLAAYNAGPGRLDDYLTRGRTLPTETRRYVAAIGPRIAGAEPGRTSPGAAYAMNAMPLDIPSGPRYTPDPRYSGAPVQLADATPAAPIALGQPSPMVSTPAAYTPAYAPAREVAQVVPYKPADLGRPIELGKPTPMPYAPMPSTPVREPVQVASMPELRPIELGRPTPERFAAAAPIPARTPSLPPSAPLPVPPAFTPAQQFASFSPRLTTPALAPASTQVASYSPPAPRGGFRLVSPAMAEPAPRSRGPVEARGAWAVQVGAFANDRLAAAANAQAREGARELGTASASVSSVKQGSATLYRARLHGLSREGAEQACERLSRQRMNCILVSPDAQS